MHAAAFARPDEPEAAPPEVELVAQLRASQEWIPELSIVAITDELIVGHVVCSRATIADSIEVLGLGPLGVHPDYQDERIGSALMHAVIGAAADHRIAAPQDSYGEHFQVRHLHSATGNEKDPFRHADAFDSVP